MGVLAAVHRPASLFFAMKRCSVSKSRSASAFRSSQVSGRAAKLLKLGQEKARAKERQEVNTTATALDSPAPSPCPSVPAEDSKLFLSSCLYLLSSQGTL